MSRSRPNWDMMRQGT